MLKSYSLVPLNEDGHRDDIAINSALTTEKMPTVRLTRIKNETGHFP